MEFKKIVAQYRTIYNASKNSLFRNYQVGIWKKKATDIAKLKIVEAKTPFMTDYMNLRTWNFLERYLHLCAKFLVVYLI